MTVMPHLSAMTWDEDDQLRSTTPNAGGTPQLTWYAYDGGGQRARKVTDQPGTTTRKAERIYLGTVEVYREYAADGTTITLSRETLHVSDGGQAAALVEDRTVGTDKGSAALVRYQHANHLGSALLELDGAASIITYEEYFPYGATSYQAVTAQTETPKRYRYTGKERDTETGLYYHGARYYAPWLGRWTACDPAGFADGLDLYAYVRGNPTRMADLNGRQGKDSGDDTKKPDAQPAADQGDDAGTAAKKREYYTSRATLEFRVAQAYREAIIQLESDPAELRKKDVQALIQNLEEDVERHVQLGTSYMNAPFLETPPQPGETGRPWYIDHQPLLVLNLSPGGQPSFLSSDYQVSAVKRDWAAFGGKLTLHSAWLERHQLEVKSLDAAAFSGTLSVHYRDPGDQDAHDFGLTGVKTHLEAGAQINLLHITKKREGEDFLEFSESVAGQEDATVDKWQLQLVSNVEWHMNEQWSVIGQAQFPLDFTGWLPPSFGIGLLFHSKVRISHDK